MNRGRIPNSADVEFNEMHMAQAWQVLHERFGFNIAVWKKSFEAYLLKQPRETDTFSAFFRFGNEQINPVINQILGRNQGFPTFNRMIDYIMKSKRI